MSSISAIRALEILDARGNPTLQVELHLASGCSGIACVPSGSSTGTFEAYELRDLDSKRYLGRGVQKAIQNIDQVIQPALLGLDVCAQRDLDLCLCRLDGTENKSNLGANAILGVSLAACRAAANFLEVPLYRYLGNLMPWAQPTLPIPMMNLINGGLHADNNLLIQEFMIVAHSFDCFAETVRVGTEVFYALKQTLKEKTFSVAVGDEGGFAPNFESHTAVLDEMMRAIELAGYVPGQEVALALDVAAATRYKESYYYLTPDQKPFNVAQCIDHYAQLISRYPIISLEDPFDEEDWAAWSTLQAHLGEAIQIVEDDLFATNMIRLKRGIDLKAANAILIKPNQIGTLSETIDTIMCAREAGWRQIISHRSGETGDTFIADLAVASGAGQIKTGSLSRSDRVEKYNRLLSIEANEVKDPIRMAKSMLSA